MNKCNPIPCDCKDGKEGLQGLKGPVGSNGVQGPTGLQGTIGLQGEQGVVGEQGVIGIKGIAGNNGTSTIVGPQGAEGPQGSEGLNGLAGSDGIDGTDGAIGTNDCDTSVFTWSDPAPIAYIGVPPNLIEVPQQNLNFFPAAVCLSWVINKKIGPGIFMLHIMGGTLGRQVLFSGRNNSCELRLGVDFGTIEMAAFDSNTDNIAGPDPLAPPYYGAGSGVLSMNGLTASTVIEVVYVEGGKWVVVDGSFNNEQFPTFT